MVVARYAGEWARQASEWYGEDERFTVHGPPDPEHGDLSEADMPLLMDAPVLQGEGEIYTDSVWENYEALPPATRIDETPVDGQGTPEESGHGYGGLTRPGASEAELGAYRGRDVGAAKRQTTTNPHYQLWHEVFFGFFTRGYEPPPITMLPNNPVFIRGINSHSVNNGPQNRPTAWSVDGDGWKRGDYEGSNVDRRFSPPNRTHGQVKYVEPDIVTIIGDAPPPDGEGDTYASPFSSLQKFMPKRRHIRGMRRDPGPWDEDIVATPVGTMPLTSADGMVAQ